MIITLILLLLFPLQAKTTNGWLLVTDAPEVFDINYPCVAPVHAPHSVPVTETITIKSWSNCHIAFKREGVEQRIFIGYRNKDTSPSIGETAIISYDRDCGQVQWVYMTVYPFKDCERVVNGRCRK